jgi:hypothetical protein
MPKPASHIVLELAKRGAEHRYAELKAEVAALEKLFSHLRYGSAVSPGLPDAVEEPPRRRRRKRKLSAAARKAIGVRMKKFWAARRKAAAKK